MPLLKLGVQLHHHVHSFVQGDEVSISDVQLFLCTILPTCSATCIWVLAAKHDKVHTKRNERSGALSCRVPTRFAVVPRGCLFRCRFKCQLGHLVRYLQLQHTSFYQRKASNCQAICHKKQSWLDHFNPLMTHRARVRLRFISGLRARNV